MCDALNELFAEELKEADLRGRTEGLRLGRSEGLQLGKSEGLHQAAVETYQEMGLNYQDTYSRVKEKYQLTEDRIIELLEPAYVQGFSLLGGEPFEPENQVELVNLLRRIKETYPAKDIWCYTGYLYDVDLPEGGKVHTDVTEEMLSYIDVLVDGEFVQEKKDITLKFRGSSNQRVLRLENGKVVEHLFDS